MASGTVTYLLPCRCGREIEVQAVQAGLEVSCACGQRVEVPTIRGLAKLRQVQRQEAPPGTGWGTRQRLLFSGGAAAGLALLYGVYLLLAGPPRPDVQAIEREFQNAPPEGLWSAWQAFQTGPSFPSDSGLDQWITLKAVKLRDQRQSHTYTLVFTFVVLVIGLAVAAVGLVYRPAPRGRGRRR